uniref:Uncharacterized protein n=1 Tax=Magallana gigas TaxID=29159 RepID=K1QFG4_MAGGI
MKTNFIGAVVLCDTINLMDNGDFNLGGKTQLFNCSSLQRIILNGTLEKTTYTMYMDMSNTQIQAFDIMDGNLSSNDNAYHTKRHVGSSYNELHNGTYYQGEHHVGGSYHRSHYSPNHRGTNTDAAEVHLQGDGGW